MKRLTGVLILLSFALLSPVTADETLPDSLELLKGADRLLVRRYAGFFPVDERYNDVLNPVLARLLKAAEPNPICSEVRLAVHYSDLGFNAVALHRVIMVDSLLLDGLSRYSQGIALYGTAANDYTDRLVAQIAAIHKSGQMGKVEAGFDMGNPYRLRPPSGMTPVTAREAQPIFEELLAGWLAHELSHILLQHAQQRYLDGNAFAAQLAMANVPPEAIEVIVRRHLDYKLGPTLEEQADRLGSDLLVKAGYHKDAIRRLMLLLKRLEDRSPDQFQVNRTHAKPVERYRKLFPSS
jgi:hypothetical protein